MQEQAFCVTLDWFSCHLFDQLQATVTTKISDHCQFVSREKELMSDNRNFYLCCFHSLPHLERCCMKKFLSELGTIPCFSVDSYAVRNTRGGMNVVFISLSGCSFAAWPCSRTLCCA